MEDCDIKIGYCNLVVGGGGGGLEERKDSLIRLIRKTRYKL